jgi:two-component system alkaline phosphatase synthesis response regulator PhoP
MSQPTILVVNDVNEMVDLFATVLYINDYLTLTAYDGKTAIALAISERPDLIVVDNIMPSVDGYEVCRAVRTNPLTSKIPIIMTTCTEMSLSVERGRAVGADGFLQLPFPMDELPQLVKAVLARGHSSE